jgi:hypothetical protein
VSEAWPAVLTTTAAGYLKDLAAVDQEQVRDALAIASRDPYGWPQWQPADPDGRDVRVARIGPLAIVYWINVARERLLVIDVNRLPL